MLHVRLPTIARRLCLPALALALAAPAFAQDKIKIGAIYPLSGNAASAGTSAKAALEVAAEILNEDHPELGDLTLAKGAGLPGLKGAKVEIVFADNQGTPAAGQNQALRLITEEKVHALVGAYQSGITLTASAIAEKYGIPFLSGESVAANLTERGFKWFFRTTPVASDIARIYMDFLRELKGSGTKVDAIAIVNENTEYGTSIAKVLREAAKENGFNISVEIPYSANTTDVQSQVLQLKDKNPDVIIFVSYTSDAILYMKTMQALGYKPPVLIGDNSGFSDASFLKTVGGIAQGAINRSAWDIGKPGSTTYQINEMYKKKTGNDLDDTSARHAGLSRSCRCDQPGGLDRSDQDPGRAQGDRPQAEPAPHGLQGRQVRREGQQHACRGAADPGPGRPVRRGLAEGQRHRATAAAL